MTKLLSDDELLAKLDSIVPKCAESDCYTCGARHARMLDLINTQKRLYAEMVVGDWVKPTMGGEVIAPGQVVNIDLEGNMKESLIFIQDNAKWGLQREQRARISNG